MATVQWVNVSSGEIIEGDENLYQANEGWLPVKWVVVKGSIFRSTLVSFAEWLRANTSLDDIKLVRNPANDAIYRVEGMVVDNKDLETIGEALNQFWCIEMGGFADILVFTYVERTTWPNKSQWVGIADANDDEFVYDDEPPGGGGGIIPRGSPKPGPGRPIPGPAPGPPGPSPAPGPAPTAPPPFPGPEPFLGEGGEGEGINGMSGGEGETPGGGSGGEGGQESSA